MPLVDMEPPGSYQTSGSRWREESDVWQLRSTASRASRVCPHIAEGLPEDERSLADQVS